MSKSQGSSVKALPQSDSKAQWSLQAALASLPPNFLPPPGYRPQKENNNPNGSSTASSSPFSNPLPFMHLVTLCKQVKREGWRRFGITDGESVADHMYRMSLMTIASPPSLATSGVDLQRATRMALVHDLAESLVGDITPVDDVPAEEKTRREREVMVYVAETLLGGIHQGAGKEVKGLWEEYEANTTKTAKWVKDVDKLELLLQTNEYESMYKGGQNLGQFTRVVKKIQTDVGLEWAKELFKERERFWTGLGQPEVTKIPEHYRINSKEEIVCNPKPNPEKS